MSVIRPRLPEDPILVAPAALVPADARRFEHVRAESLHDPVVLQPARMLSAYQTHRATSELFALLSRARGIREAVDRLVFVAGGPSHHAMRLLFGTCCHPFHNDLDRGGRGGRPRLFFAGQDFDGDVLAGLLDLVGSQPALPRDDLLDRFGIVAVDDADPDGPVHAAFDVLLPELLRQCAPADGFEDRLTVVSPGGLPGDWPAAAARFSLPSDLPAWCTAFTASAILPAAIVGIDVVRLLEGAVAMNRRFAEAPAATNPVACFVNPGPGTAGECRLVCRQTGRLAPLTDWHEAVRGMPSGMGGIVEVTIGEPRRDPLLDRAGVPWRVRAERGGDVAGIRMPRLDEHAIGQLLQMLLIATVVVRRLDSGAAAASG